MMWYRANREVLTWLEERREFLDFFVFLLFWWNESSFQAESWVEQLPEKKERLIYDAL